MGDDVTWGRIGNEDAGDAAAANGDDVDDDDGDNCDDFTGDAAPPPTLNSRRSGECEPPTLPARAMKRHGLSYLQRAASVRQPLRLQFGSCGM